MASRAADPDDPFYVHPGERTVGQSIGEGIRLYGRHFWKALAAAAPPLIAAAIAFSLSDDDTSNAQGAVSFIALDLMITLSFVLSCALVLGHHGRRSLLTGYLAGITVAIPTQIVFVTMVNALQGLGVLVGATLLIPLLLSYFGLAVPAAVAEGHGYLASLKRGFELGRASLFHLWGGLTAVTLLVGLSWLLLAGLLANMAGLDGGVAGILAALVLAPLPLLVGPVLYEDQRERARPPIEEAM